MMSNNAAAAAAAAAAAGAEIQFVSAYNRSGRQQQSIALKSPRSLRRRLPPAGSPSSSPRRSAQNDRGQLVYRTQQGWSGVRQIGPCSVLLTEQFVDVGFEFLLSISNHAVPFIWLFSKEKKQ